MISEFFNDKNRTSVLLLHFSALIAGLLLPFAFAPYNQYWLAFPLMAWLFLSCVNQAPSIAFKRSWLFGFGWFAHGVSWIYYSLHVHGGAPSVLAYLIIALLSMYLALFPGLAMFIARKFFPVSINRQLLIVFPLMFVLAEWFRGYFLTGFSWVQLGYSQIDSWLIGYAPLVGGLGISGVIALVSGLMAVVIFKREYKLPLLAGISVFLLGYLLMQLNWTEASGERIKVSLVQGNVAQKDKWKPYMHRPTLNLYRDLTEKNWDSDLIIWPETAIPDYEHRVRDYLDGLTAQAKQQDKDVLLGIFVADSATTRYYNTMMSLQGGIYKKRHLVPLGEFYPFRSILGFFSQWINIPMSDIAPGPEQQPMMIAAGQKLGISICFEDAFDRDVMRDLPEADLLVNVSNDAWFEDSAEAAQHHQIARMRAVEAGRVMLRSTNTGISSMIGPKGNVLALAPQFERYVLTDDVDIYKGTTPYVIWKNYLVVSVSILILFAYWFRLRSRST